MYILAILDTAPDHHGLAQRAGEQFTAGGYVLAIMNGVRRERAALFRPTYRVAEGAHWVLWWESADPPPELDQVTAWLVTEAEREPQ